MTAQPGVLALGATDHEYLEFDLSDPSAPAAALTAAAQLTRDLATTAGVNIVVGVRPSLWRQVADPSDVPQSAQDWQEDLVGPDGFVMPATQTDLWVWISGGGRTPVFDAGRAVLAGLSRCCVLVRETTGWVYRQDRDLTGFIDGTENPTMLEAPTVVCVPEGRPGAGGTVLLFQLWRHDTARWEGEPVEVQEKAMGRTKADSTELSDRDKPADAHVARTVIEVDGREQHIFRRNVAYGGITEHGTVFVGFSLDQWRLAEMLRRMAGVGDGIRCALTRYLTPLTGGYFTVPSIEALTRLAPVDATDAPGG